MLWGTHSTLLPFRRLQFLTTGDVSQLPFRPRKNKTLIGIWGAVRFLLIPPHTYKPFSDAAEILIFIPQNQPRISSLCNTINFISYFYFCVYVCVMYVHVQMGVCMCPCGYTRVHVWRWEVNVRCFSQSLSTLIIEAESLTLELID